MEFVSCLRIMFYLNVIMIAFLELISYEIVANEQMKTVKKKSSSIHCFNNINDDDDGI